MRKLWLLLITLALCFAVNSCKSYGSDGSLKWDRKIDSASRAIASFINHSAMRFNMNLDVVVISADNGDKVDKLEKSVLKLLSVPVALTRLNCCDLTFPESNQSSRIIIVNCSTDITILFEEKKCSYE